MTDGSSCAPGVGGERLPREFREVEAALAAALDAASRAGDWDASTRAAVLAWVGKLRDRMARVEGHVLSAERQAGTWSLHGDRDLAGFLGRQSHAGRGAGMAAVAQASTLEAMPAVADALVDGPVTVTHVQQIARATTASPLLAAELATPEGQSQLVELAGRLDGAEFGTALKAMSASLDPAARQRTHDEQCAARYLNVTRTPGGTLVKAQLDDVAGYEFVKVLDAYNPRPALDDERSAEQRRADALMTMVHQAQSDESLTPGALAPVLAIVTIAEETWTALRGATASGGARSADVAGGADDAPSAGSAARVATALRGVAPVVDETGQAWPASEVARALCDCTLTRAVVDGRGQVLDLGRGERYFQRRHWLALLAVGIRTCVWPGCSMPLRNTELHHLTWWDRHKGSTSLDNCGPYCRYHHDWIHHHDISVRRLAGGQYEHYDRHGLLIGIGGRTVAADGRPHASEDPAGVPAGTQVPPVGPPGDSPGERGEPRDGPNDPPAERQGKPRGGPPGTVARAIEQPPLWST